MGQFSLALRGVSVPVPGVQPMLRVLGIDYFSSVCNADQCGAVFPRF